MAVRVLEFRESPRFRSGFQRASPGLQRLAIQEVRTLERRLKSSAATGFHTYGVVRGLGTTAVRELELGGGPRLLAHYKAGIVTLLDIGGHSTTDEYDSRKLAADLARSYPADPFITVKSTIEVNTVFGSNPDARVSVFGTELTAEWIYFLTDPQNAFVNSSVREYQRSTKNKPSFRFAVGGPGTGKTSILLKIFVELRKRGGRPGFLLADPVADYIERTSGVHLGDDRVSVDDWQLGRRTFDEFDALLFDDPGTADLIEVALQEITGNSRLAVVAFDPYQLSTDLTDEDYAELIRRCDAEVRQFHICYRQKEVVGRAARRVMGAIAQATPYLADEKVEAFQAEHSGLSRLANDARYPNPYGYEQTYAPAKESDARREIRRIRASPLWDHSPSVLLVLDGSSEAAAWDWTSILARVAHQRIDIRWDRNWGSGVWGRLTTVKGLEFQHVLIALSLPAFVEMDLGFAGSGKSNYLARRLARIPFSRAKDSLVTFCAGPEDLTLQYLAERQELRQLIATDGIVDVYKYSLVLQAIVEGQS